MFSLSSRIDEYSLYFDARTKHILSLRESTLFNMVYILLKFHLYTKYTILILGKTCITKYYYNLFEMRVKIVSLNIPFESKNGILGDKFYKLRIAIIN